MSHDNEANRELIEEIHNGIDLGFSDYYEDQNVRDRTLGAHAADLHRAVKLLTLEEAMNFSVFQSFGPRHPSTEIYILDFPSDLRAALYLLLGGYYRPAILSLRNWFEMRLLGTYFGCIETDAQKYQQWKLGVFQAPMGRRLIGRLFSRKEFRKVEPQLNLRNELASLYSELSAFTHGSGLEKHSLQSDTDNVPRYNRASVILWLELLKRTFAQITISLYLAYGKATFDSLNTKEMELVLENLPLAYRSTVRGDLDEPNLLS